MSSRANGGLPDGATVQRAPALAMSPRPETHARDSHVNLFLYGGAFVPDPDGISPCGHGNETARMILPRRGEKIDTTALVTVSRQILANDRAGLWRKLKSLAEQGDAGR